MSLMRHIFHCITLCTLWVFVQSALNYYNNSLNQLLETKWRLRSESLTTFGYFSYACITISLTISIIGRVYYTVMTCAGLLFHNCFPEPVNLKTTAINRMKLPLISLRIVTKGSYPDLIKANVEFNKKLCLKVGLKRFVIEVVTENKIDLGIFANDDKIKQIVVPSTYVTKRGTLFKGRNLQYCLEDGVSALSDNDWILHLDEDSLLTEDAVKGLAKFIHDGKYPIGQGFINYDPDNRTGPATKFLSGLRLTGQLGAIRFFIKTLNILPTVMMGSFVACKVKVEKDVSFDGGPTASITEFFYLSMIGHKKGYRLGWIEGVINEVGPLTICEAIQQNARTFNGAKLLLKNPDINGIFYFGVFSFYWWFAGFVFSFVGLLLTLFVQLDYLGQPLLYFQGILITNDIYTGFFVMYFYKNISATKWVLLFMLNFTVGWIDFILTICVSICKGALYQEISFKVTKKEI